VVLNTTAQSEVMLWIHETLTEMMIITSFRMKELQKQDLR